MVLLRCVDGRWNDLSLSSSTTTLHEIKEAIFEKEGYLVDSQVLTLKGDCDFNGGVIDLSRVLYIDVKLRLLGGKGGFGSLLRGGPQGVKKVSTTNYDACRDLDGRRLRHMNNERKLREWEDKRDEVKEKREEERKQFEEEARAQKEMVVLESVQKFVSERDIAVENIYKSVKSLPKDKDLSGFLKSENFESKKETEKEKEEDDENIDLAEYGLDFDFDDDEDAPLPSPSPSPSPPSSSSSSSPSPSSSSSSSSSSTSLEANASSEKQEVPKDLKGEDGESSGVDFAQYTSAEAMESLGAAFLKEELQRRGMKCGGTVKERAIRLFLAINPSESEAVGASSVRSGGGLKRKRETSAEPSLPKAKVLVK